MSQKQASRQESPSAQYKTPELMFSGDARLEHRQRSLTRYVVVALSERKQCKIMESVGQMYCQDQPFPTWNLVGRALSKALFVHPDCLLLKSRMELHQRDYLLFERVVDPESAKLSGTTASAGSVLEVGFGKHSKGAIWEGYWKIARPIVVRYVQNCRTFRF